jgi:hypothetical protein
VVKRGLSVRDVEELGRREGSGASAHKKRATVRDTNIEALENQIALSLGADVQIRAAGSGFELRIRIKELDQLNYVCERIVTLSPSES